MPANVLCRGREGKSAMFDRSACGWPASMADGIALSWGTAMEIRPHVEMLVHHVDRLARTPSDPKAMSLRKLGVSSLMRAAASMVVSGA